MSDYTDGSWYAATLGEFIAILVDSGRDVAVTFHIVEDTEPDEEGNFERAYELVLHPNGYVADAIQGCRGVHKTLRALLEAGVVR